MNSDIMLLAAASTALVKSAVDMIRIAFPERPAWVSPVLAILLGVIFCLLLLVSNGAALSGPEIAQGILAGVMSATSAIGLTELQKRSG